VYGLSRRQSWLASLKQPIFCGRVILHEAALDLIRIAGAGGGALARAYERASKGNEALGVSASTTKRSLGCDRLCRAHINRWTMAIASSWVSSVVIIGGSPLTAVGLHISNSVRRH
jgi:hypothetical protein